MKLTKKLTEKTYLAGFSLVVVFLAIIRFTVIYATTPDGSSDTENSLIVPNSIFYDENGKRVKHKIYSVPSYRRAFPDDNDVQLASARAHGVKPVEDRKEAERHKKDLVFVGSSPYYHVDELTRSIPYLVPKAAILLQDIGSNFFDSLAVKQIPMHKIIVTSVLRTKHDVKKLRRHNGNATENSCHLYGTTFDISYHRYITPTDNRKVRNDSLKWVLSEVLDDLRKNDRCHIKYEVKQGCFHITVK